MSDGQKPDERTSEDQSPDEGDAAQVSEVSGMRDPSTPISPGDATAGYPPSESGHADEGTAGPDAAPRREAEESPGDLPHAD
ncbi:hypothetical protein [Mumia sp. Pv 4-285]|uniref:hypothetical protein n=1 Tax=Mumia qirimensis TaxID=3234852 RepID=UPI00351D31B6